MSKTNLFIGSLAYATTDESLAEFFATIGEVESAKVMTDRDTGRSRGFGFVTFVNEEDNKKAVEQLDGKDLDGRAINVSEARPREERPFFSWWWCRRSWKRSWRQRWRFIPSA